MSNISKITEILGKAKEGQFISLKYDGSSTDFFAAVVQLGTDKVQAVKTEDWEEGWPKDESTELGPLCFTAEEANSTVKLQANGSAPTVNLKTSTDNGSTWSAYSVGDTITLANVGDKVCFIADGSNAKMGSSNSKYNQFVMTGSISASGNVNSLLEENEDTARTMSLAGNTYCYNSLFQDCTSLTQAPELPAMTLADRCYRNMFIGCTSLTQAPALPATTLANNCYFQMFKNCTSLKTAPELQATVLANYCYSSMFEGCTSLTQAPELPATTLATNCYAGMFSGCTSLTTAPELPATTLAVSCYVRMFYGCSSLTSAPALPATTLATSCYSQMFQNCTSLKTAPELQATVLANYCYSYMFQGCTSLASAPELPAMTLASYCYIDMFEGCTKFSDCHMKATMESVYDPSIHGDISKTVIYDL